MIDQILSELADLGWLLNNCYQVDAEFWRVNLRQPDGEGDWFTEWAEGSSLEEALLECMGKLSTAEFSHTPESRSSIDQTRPLSLAELLRPKAKITIERRI